MTEEKTKEKFTFTIEGCPYADKEMLNIYTHAMDSYCSLFEVDQFIRNRLKYSDDCSETEEKTLLEIRDLLELWRYEN